MMRSAWRRRRRTRKSLSASFSSPEKDQKTLLVDDDGKEMYSTAHAALRKERKVAREMDEDEIAVMNDPDPWQWPHKLKYVTSIRVKLKKSQSTRHSRVEYSAEEPPIIEHTYFQDTKEGEKAFRRAKRVSKGTA